MTTLTEKLRLFARYKAWADDAMFAALAALPEGEATKARVSLFRDMLHTMNHILVIDTIWRGHLEGRDHGFAARNTPDYPPLAEMRRAQAAMDAWYVAYADGLSDAQADETVAFTFIGGGAGAMNRADMILHVVNHASYHRGFVADMLYAVPAKAPQMDYTVFIRDAAG